MSLFNTPSAQSIIAEAARRGLTTRPLGARNILSLVGYGRCAWLRGTITNRTSHLAVLLADDKRASKQVLAESGVPTPPAFAVDSEDEAMKAFDALGGYVAVKPYNGREGRSVSAGLTTPAQVRDGFRKAARLAPVVLVERHHEGNDYRVLVVDGTVVAVAERIAPCAVGDGHRCVAEIIEEMNNDTRRGDGHERPLTKIAIDNDMVNFLQRSGRTLSTVPRSGERVLLSDIRSVSRGSSSRDCTLALHPDMEQLAIRAANAIGLDIAGIDVIARDIRLPTAKADAQVIEVNCSPGLRLHLVPGEGAPRNPAIPILDYLFPETRRMHAPMRAAPICLSDAAQ